MSLFYRVLELFLWDFVCFISPPCVSGLQAAIKDILNWRFAYSEAGIPLSGEQVSRNRATRVQPPPVTSRQIIQDM